ncbi:MAG: radical SAM family heme chaperone HemW [Bryobacteraceae bacterium]
MSGVYISYPFCTQKCTYCNFASGVLPPETERTYLAALSSEIAAHRWHWTPETIYLGGGTPSRLAADDLAGILNALPGRPWSEATIEVAPGTIHPDLAAAWRNAGINRVSLGVQSFVARELRQTGRRHDAATVAAEIDILRAAGIGNINIDLIAGLPWQTAESWRESLDWIRRLDPPHVSVYILEVDEDSRLGNELLVLGSRYGAAQVPDEEMTAELYETAVDALAGDGTHRYEISNFAKPGRESRHNLKYWRREPYVGFGVDAHSFDGRVRRANCDSTAGYIDRIHREGTACVEEAPANDEERFFVGLRLSGGVDVTPGERARHAAAIDRFVQAGLLEFHGAQLRLTDRGVLVSNEVLAEFVGG